METCDQVDDIIHHHYFVKSQFLTKSQCYTKQRYNTSFRPLSLLLGGGTGVVTHDLCSKVENESERSVFGFVLTFDF